MTITELYKWAVKNGYEDKTLVIYPQDPEATEENYLMPYEEPLYSENDDFVII